MVIKTLLNSELIGLHMPILGQGNRGC